MREKKSYSRSYHEENNGNGRSSSDGVTSEIGLKEKHISNQYANNIKKIFFYSCFDKVMAHS